MSCFPQNKRNDDAIDLKMFNKICFQAAFAKRAKDKPAGSNQSKTNTSNPGYLKPSRAAVARNEEKMRQRDIDNAKKAKDNEYLLNSKKNAKAKQKELEAAKKLQVRLAVSIDADILSKNSITDAPKSVEMSAFSPVKTAIRGNAIKDESESDSGPGGAPPMERWSPIKRRKQPAMPSRADKWLDRQILATKVECCEPPPALSIDEQPVLPAKMNRYGGEESFSYNDPIVDIPKMSAKRCYRVLTFTTDKNGERQVMDIPEGNIYWCRTGTQKRRITPDAIAMDSKQAAMSERFPMTQVGASASGNGTLPRVLVAFDCWGKCNRRYGGGLGAKYEYVKYIRIEEFLNPPKTVSKKQSEHPIHPHCYPKRDHSPTLQARKPIEHSVFVDKAFDTRPWRRATGGPVSPRTNDLMSSVNHVKAKVPVLSPDDGKKSK